MCNKLEIEIPIEELDYFRDQAIAYGYGLSIDRVDGLISASAFMQAYEDGQKAEYLRHHEAIPSSEPAEQKTYAPYDYFNNAPSISPAIMDWIKAHPEAEQIRVPDTCIDIELGEGAAMMRLYRTMLREGYVLPSAEPAKESQPDMLPWKSIKERPKEYTQVLLWFDGLKSMATGYLINGSWVDEHKKPFWAEPDLWTSMPLAPGQAAPHPEPSEQPQPAVDNNWIRIEDSLPKKGERVRCKLSKDIGFGTTEKSLYRMKHNGKWNDYHDLVTHWKPLAPPSVKLEREENSGSHSPHFCEIHQREYWGICLACHPGIGAPHPPVSQPSPTAQEREKKGPWKLEVCSYQIGNTGDYDGHYELTDGKVSIFTKDDTEDGYLEKVVDALNETGCKFYLDDSNEFCLYHERQRADDLQSQLSAAQQKIEDGNDAYALLEQQMEAKQAEAQEYRKELSSLLDMDDLSHLTRANQIIIERILEKYPQPKTQG